MANDPSKLYPNTPERLKSLAGKLVSLEFTEGNVRVFYPDDMRISHITLNKFDVFVFLGSEIHNKGLQCTFRILHPEHGPLSKTIIIRSHDTWFKLAEET